METTLNAKVGDSYEIDLMARPIVDGFAVQRSLAGASLAVVVRYGPTADADLAPSPNLVADIGDADEGIVSLSMVKDHALKPGTYFYEVDAIYSATDRKTVLHGVLNVAPSLFGG